MEKKLCHNCLGDMYPDGNGWKCCACGVCMDADGRHYMPAPPPLTNADRIRSMSDEELAKAIRIHVGSSEDVACCYCHGDKGCINADGGINCDDKTEETCIVAWLRQPVQPTPDAPDTHEHSGLWEE